MEKRSSANSSSNFDTTLTIDSDLTKQVNGDQCSTAASFSERSAISLPKPTKLPFYRNLVEEVRKEKSEDKLRRKATLDPNHEENLLQNAKKTYHKSKTDFVQQLGENEVEQLTGGNSQPMNIVINNMIHFGSQQIDESDESLLQSCANGNDGFINRVKNPIVCSSFYGTSKKDLEELPFRHLVFNKEFPLTKKEFIQHLRKIQKGLQYAKYLIKPPEQDKVAAKAVPLEKITKGMKTLVLDLDGTLVHLAENKSDGHVVLQMKGEGESQSFGIRFRPYLNYFLEKVSKKYEIIVFTAGQADYASAVVDYIDPEQKFIKYVISRDRCLVTKNGFFLKDLRILSGRDLKDILIVDNLTHSFCLQIENGIPIIDYQNDPNDKELKYLAKYLLKCAEAENVQDFNSQELRLRDLLNFELSSIDKKF